MYSRFSCSHQKLNSLYDTQRAIPCSQKKNQEVSGRRTRRLRVFSSGQIPIEKYQMSPSAENQVHLSTRGHHHFEQIDAGVTSNVLKTFAVTQVRQKGGSHTALKGAARGSHAKSSHHLHCNVNQACEDTQSRSFSLIQELEKTCDCFDLPQRKRCDRLLNYCVV